MPIIDTEGTYRVKVVSKDFCKSSKGAEQLAIGYEVVEGPQAGHHLTDFLSFSDKALQYTEKKMRVLGWQGVDLADLSTLGSNEVEIVCATEVYEGVSRMKVKFVNAIGSGGAKIDALDDAAKKAFAARMRAKIVGLNAAQAKAPAAKQSKPAGREEPPPPDDGDIPF